jgi:hypothetical protein
MRDPERCKSSTEQYRRRGKTKHKEVTYMSNELKDIAYKLEGFDEKGWMITSAQRNPDGSWDLHILKRPIEEPKKEAADDNN